VNQLVWDELMAKADRLIKAFERIANAMEADAAVSKAHLARADSEVPKVTDNTMSGLTLKAKFDGTKWMYSQDGEFWTEEIPTDADA
jgi:hypothetical protein